MVREAGVEPAAARLSIECSNHAELFPDVNNAKRGAPCQTRTGFSGLQIRRIGVYAYRACEIMEPMERIERSSVAYHATALPLSYIGWSQRGYSKPRPPRYKCGALPLELLRLGMERVRRIELRSSDWRSDAQPIGDTRKTLERTEIIEISSLGWRPRAHPIYHARKKHIQLSRTSTIPESSPF